MATLVEDEDALSRPRENRVSQAATQNSAAISTMVAVVWALVVARPHPNFVPTAFSVYMADGIILAVWFATLLVAKLRVPIRAVGAISSYWLTASINALLLLVVSIENRTGPEAAMVNLAKFAFYGLALVFLSSTLLSARTDWSRIHKLLKFAVLGNAGIVLLQLLNPPVFGPLVRSFFGDDKLRDLWTGWPRVYGAFANANWFGVFVVFSFLFYAASYLNGLIPLRSVAAYGLTLFSMLIFSGSRTAALGLVVAIAFLLIYYRRFWITLLVAIVAYLTPALLSLLGTQIPYLQKTVDRFLVVLSNPNSGSISELHSVEGREGSWRDAWAAFQQHPLVGYGDGSLGTDLVPHNSYLALLLTVGLLGAVPLVGWILGTIPPAFSHRPASPSSATARMWLISFSLAFLVMMLAADFFFTTQIMVLWIFVAAWYWASRDIAEESTAGI